MTTFAIATLGCKVIPMSHRDMRVLCWQRAINKYSFKEKADVYIINTCAVTNTAGSKSRQKIHQAKALNQNALIAVVGCYVQTAKEQLEQQEHVDILIGSDGKRTLADRIEKALQGEKQVNEIHDVRALRVFEALPIQHFEHQTRAFLKTPRWLQPILQLLYHSLCPWAERSLPEDEVIKIAQDLCASGHQYCKKCYAGNRGSDHTISIQWIRNGRKSGDRIYISSFDGICRCYRSRTDRMVYHGYSIARTDHKNTEIKSK